MPASSDAADIADTSDTSDASLAPAGRRPRERFIAALERRPLPGRVPTFELVFFLTMEAFGRVHPLHRQYDQWLQMTDAERALHRADAADLYIKTAETYGHDAIFVHPNPGDVEEACRLIDVIRERSGDRYFLAMHGDCTYAIPPGSEMESLSIQMMEEPDAVEAHARERLDAALASAERFSVHGGLDGLMLCSDYCFNSGPFLPLPWFDRFVTPYLHRSIAAYKEMGFYVVKHTDGNIMPILDRLVPDDEASRPHALHSLDPQGGVDLGEIIERVADRVALCGNVDCGLLQTGSEEQCLADIERSIRQGLAAPGYIFSTSNCVYTGMPLDRYELVIDTYRRLAIRGNAETT